MTALNQMHNIHPAGLGALGKDVRNLRKSRGLTLSELALKMGRSVGFISQVERGLSVPSIQDLRAIASALDIPISWFFTHDSLDDNERGVVVRADTRRVLGSRESGLTEELLSPDLGGSFEMVRSIFEPGAEIKDNIQRETEESGVVVSGRLDVWIEDQLFELNSGDSFKIDHKPYRWRNPGSEPAIVIWVVSPPNY